MFETTNLTRLYEFSFNFCTFRLSFLNLLTRFSEFEGLEMDLEKTCSANTKELINFLGVVSNYEKSVKDFAAELTRYTHC